MHLISTFHFYTVLPEGCAGLNVSAVGPCNETINVSIFSTYVAYLIKMGLGFHALPRARFSSLLKVACLYPKQMHGSCVSSKSSQRYNLSFASYTGPRYIDLTIHFGLTLSILESNHQRRRNVSIHNILRYMLYLYIYIYTCIWLDHLRVIIICSAQCLVKRSSWQKAGVIYYMSVGNSDVNGPDQGFTQHYQDHMIAQSAL